MRPIPPIQFARDPKRILIIKPSALGDVVHTLPILNLLRKRFPAAEITWMISPAFAGILKGHPQVDHLIRFDRRGLSKNLFTGGWFSDVNELVEQLAAPSFDLVIDLQGLFRSGWIAGATQAPVRVGFAAAREGASFFYTHRITTGDPEQHAIERYLSIAEALGCGRGPVEFLFPTDATDRANVQNLLLPGERYAVLLPGTNWATKRWPVEKFAKLVRPLWTRFGLRSVVAGGRDSTSLAQQIPIALDLTGKTSLRELVALIEGASLVIANDTGPMHIAAALGRPMVTLFGPTNPVRTGPYQRMETVLRVDLPCSPCYSRTCSHQSCLQWLEVEPVLSLAAQQLEAAAAVKMGR